VSSIKANQEASADEVRNMTMQWGYSITPAQLREGRRARHLARREARHQLELPESVKYLLSVVFALAGASTTILAVAWLTGWTVI